MKNKAKSFAAQRVLVVEDEGVIAADLKGIIKSFGISDINNVSHIKQLRVCIEIALREQNGTPYYALILLDKQIKGDNNAFEFIKDLRMISKSIILTSSHNGDCEHLAEIMDGIAAVPKPFNSAVMSNNIKEALAKAA